MSDIYERVMTEIDQQDGRETNSIIMDVENMFFNQRNKGTP